MSKTPSKKLFDLIHSLSGSEKRYFKLFANKKGLEKGNKYIQLFNAISAQEIFDETALQQLVYGKQPIESRKYSELKSYLYDLILKALQGYDEKTSYDYKLKGMLQSIRVLYKRGHYNDCKEVIQKAKKLAYKYEAFGNLPELLNWQKQIAYTLIDVSFFEEELEIIDQEERNCLEQLRKLSTYRNEFFKVYVLLKKVTATNRTEIRTQLQKILQNPILTNEDLPSSHQTKIYFHRIHSVYQYAMGNYEEFYKSSQQLTAIMESKPFFLKEDVSEYISVLNNHIVSCRTTDRYQEWLETLDKLRAISPNTHDDALKIHRQYYQGIFSWCILTGNFEKGKAALETHLKTVQQFGTDLFERSAFYFLYFQIYFGNGDYDAALDYLNQWLNQPKSLERQDLQNLARLLNLIVHYEMGNTLLLESLLRSTYRYLKRVDQLRPIERKILNFIKNSMKVYSQKEMTAYYIDLQKDLEGLSETGKVGPFDLAAWLESKIKRKPFAQIVQEKFKLMPQIH